MPLRSLFPYLVALVALTACAGSEHDSMTRKISARPIVSMMDCGTGGQLPDLSVISSHQQLDGAMGRIASQTGQTFGDQIKVSFDQEMLVQINMGQKSSGGYSLALIKDMSVLKDGWAVIFLQWNVPEEGMMLTQALTSPCLFVAIPRHDYQGIRVLDQSGQIRLQTRL